MIFSEYKAKLEHAYSVYPEKRFKNNPNARFKALLFSSFAVMLACQAMISRVVNTSAADRVSYPDGDASQVAEAGIGNEVVIQFTGDVMCHDGQIKDAEVTTNHFIFDRSYTEIRDILSVADLSVTTFDGVISTDEKGYSGHPKYQTPVEFVRALSTAGNDVVSINSANIYNDGEDGLNLTKEKIGGTSTVLWNEPIIQDVEGVKIGLVPVYADDLDDKNTDYNSYNKSELRKNVKLCEDKNADFIIAYVRWPNEAGYVPTEDMREKSKYLISIGFDLVVGGGNHSVLPSEYITTDKYGYPGEKASGMVFYSLGNMLSNQRTSLGDVGAIVNLRLRKINSEKTRLVGYEIIPTYTNVDLEDGRNFKIVPVSEGGTAPEWMDSYNKNRYSEVYSIVETMIDKIS